MAALLMSTPAQGRVCSKIAFFPLQTRSSSVLLARKTVASGKLHRRVCLAVRASDASAPTEGSAAVSAASAPAATSRAGKEIIPDSEISITKTSFGTIGLTVGVALLVYGFSTYFTIVSFGADFSALMLTYGFPLTIIGFALKYAELKPVPCTSYADAVALREKEATPILLQVRSDVTRYRYGDEQHLEEALKRIFRYNQAGGIQRRNAPTLTSISEEVYEGHYSLVLVFSAPALKLADFTDRQAKFTSFFGPGVNATVEKMGQDEYAVRLTASPQ